MKKIVKTFYIKTLGCKVNQYESQLIREQLLDNGFEEVSQKGNPDICIVNTCSVTGKAQSKGKYYVNQLNRQYPGSYLAVTGSTVNYDYNYFDSKARLLIKGVKGLIKSAI